MSNQIEKFYHENEKTTKKIINFEKKINVAADINKVETLAVVVEEQRLRIDSILYGIISLFIMIFI
jgi:hypothetical protein